MLLLAIETSCDETSVAVVRDGRVLANVVSSQIRLHAEYGGVVPELAAREHLGNLLPVAHAALKKSGTHTEALDAVAATTGPGLPGALLIGSTAAQSMALALDKPFLGIHHHEAHLYSPWIKDDQARFDTLPAHVALIVSGGHTLLVHVTAFDNHQVLGSTVDDAAGECFDKTAKLLGLAYPGGPEIDRLAAEGNPKACSFPRPMLKEANDDFSFSGLKTAVRYFLDKHPDWREDRNRVCDLCASVQAAIVEVLVTKTLRAARRLCVDCVTASGGVICNRALRDTLEAGCRKEGLSLRLALPRYCTDNAGMIGVVAEEKLKRGTESTPLDTEIRPGWELEEW